MTTGATFSRDEPLRETPSQNHRLLNPNLLYLQVRCGCQAGDCSIVECSKYSPSPSRGPQAAWLNVVSQLIWLSQLHFLYPVQNPASQHEAPPLNPLWIPYTGRGMEETTGEAGRVLPPAVGVVHMEKH